MCWHILTIKKHNVILKVVVMAPCVEVGHLPHELVHVLNILTVDGHLRWETRFQKYSQHLFCQISRKHDRVSCVDGQKGVSTSLLWVDEIGIKRRINGFPLHLTSMAVSHHLHTRLKKIRGRKLRLGFFILFSWEQGLSIYYVISSGASGLFCIGYILSGKVPRSGSPD